MLSDYQGGITMPGFTRNGNVIFVIDPTLLPSGVELEQSTAALQEKVASVKIRRMGDWFPVYDPSIKDKYVLKRSVRDGSSRASLENKLINRGIPYEIEE
jgi:hypothetical protein